MPLIGVLAVQGAYMAHVQMLNALGADTRLVRSDGDLSGLDGMVLPGGESTTMLRFLSGQDKDGRGDTLLQSLRKFVMEKPVLGTCAGLILLSKEVMPSQASLGVLDVRVQRNAYGRQRDSRILHVESHLPGGPLEMVFIRAPRIEEAGPSVEVLAEREGAPVLVKQGHMIGCAFHPELGKDTRIHELLLEQCAASLV